MAWSVSTPGSRGGLTSRGDSLARFAATDAALVASAPSAGESPLAWRASHCSSWYGATPMVVLGVGAGDGVEPGAGDGVAPGMGDGAGSGAGGGVGGAARTDIGSESPGLAAGDCGAGLRMYSKYAFARRSGLTPEARSDLRSSSARKNSLARFAATHLATMASAPSAGVPPPAELVPRHGSKCVASDCRIGRARVRGSSVRKEADANRRKAHI